ncbi:MAG: hypothetical protein LBD97_02825, partial [Bifidobacteriaceae bacterium]|nr:hypothetical protein [Bifidobacteriaceae bacterium]
LPSPARNAHRTRLVLLATAIIGGSRLNRAGAPRPSERGAKIPSVSISAAAGWVASLRRRPCSR